jgi:hypothetical protein
MRFSSLGGLNAMELFDVSTLTLHLSSRRDALRPCVSVRSNAHPPSAAAASAARTPYALLLSAMLYVAVAC